MPKTKKRKKTKQYASSVSTGSQESVKNETPARIVRPVRSRGTGLQGVTFAAMLTFGFLGMAIFFTFFYADDANHYFYGAVAALTALGWLLLLARRWSVYRQSA
jgi:hypothetical protein